MGIFTGNATAGKSTEVPSEGNHPGALVALIDLGTHDQDYQDGKTGEGRKIFLVFELDEKIDGQDQNHVIGKEVTLTFSPKSKLRKIMEGLRGKSYADGEQIDVAKAVGSSGLINVKHGTSEKSGNHYAKFEDVSPLPKGMPPFKPSLPLTTWEIGCGKPFPEFGWLPWSFLNRQPVPLKKVMEASKEMRGGTDAPKSNGSNGTQQNHTAPTSAPASQDAEEPIPF